MISSAKKRKMFDMNSYALTTTTTTFDESTSIDMTYTYENGLETNRTRSCAFIFILSFLSTNQQSRSKKKMLFFDFGTIVVIAEHNYTHVCRIKNDIVHITHSDDTDRGNGKE